MVAYLCRCLLGMAMIGCTIASQPATSSPSASTDLICHTDVSAECYPRIFQPTKDFQTIRDDQDLPPGLHVRLNIYTGLKEARLNIPMEGEETLVDMPTEHAVVVVEQPAVEDVEQNDPPSMRDKLHRKPPEYDAAGKILAPMVVDASGVTDDPSQFVAALAFIDHSNAKEDVAGPSEETLTTLSTLGDLSHDLYYGVEIAKNAQILKWLLHNLQDASNSIGRTAAARVIANSVSNNPTAVRQLLSTWTKHQCASSTNSHSDTDCEKHLATFLVHRIATEDDVSTLKALISALAGLSKDLAFRNQFVTAGGLDQILSYFSTKWDDLPDVQTRAARFVMDAFLDGDMGAVMDSWPSITSNGIGRPTTCMMERECWTAYSTTVSEVVAKMDRESSSHAEEMRRFLDLLAMARSRAGEIHHGDL